MEPLSDDLPDIDMDRGVSGTSATTVLEGSSLSHSSGGLECAIFNRQVFTASMRGPLCMLRGPAVTRMLNIDFQPLIFTIDDDPYKSQRVAPDLPRTWTGILLSNDIDKEVEAIYRRYDQSVVLLS